MLSTENEAEARAVFRLCSQDQWNYSRAKRELKDEDWKASVVPILYRPFDVRWTVYDRNVAVHRRERVMRHVLDNRNLGLITVRKAPPTSDCGYFLVTLGLIVNGTIRSDNQSIDYIFPLYLRGSDDDKRQATLELPPVNESVNLAEAFTSMLSSRLGLAYTSQSTSSSFSAEDVFNYMYATFYSSAYRTRYADFLKADFPRVPVTSDPVQFRELSKMGASLVSLHLLEASHLNTPITEFPRSGSNRVEKGFPKYFEPGAAEPGTGKRIEEGRVYLNTDQYFGNVPAETWHFLVGGYQVCEKWLKDRRGRALDYDDIQHYQKIVTALFETGRIMQEIDAAIPTWPIQ